MTHAVDEHAYMQIYERNLLVGRFISAQLAHVWVWQLPW